MTTDHFTTADGTHFVNGHPAPCCEEPRERLVIERDAQGRWHLPLGNLPLSGAERALFRQWLDRLAAAVERGRL